MSTQTDIGPRIYVASLSDYNAGRLHGAWIDAEQNPEDIQEAVDRMLEDSHEPNILVRIGVCQACEKRFRKQVSEPADAAPSVLVCPECESTNIHVGDLTPSAEEWAIHDYEGFEGWELSEWERFERVSEYAQLIAEHGAAWPAYVGHVGEEYATEDDFREAFCGEWRSEEEYAEALVDHLGMLEADSTVAMYFDYEAFAGDLFMGDYWSTYAPGGLVYVFRSL
jgi:antirestriction protein